MGNVRVSIAITGTGLDRIAAGLHLARTALDQRMMREQQAHDEYRVRMRLVGISDQEVADHDAALTTFAQSTLWPNYDVIARGRELAQREAATTGRIIPSDVMRWTEDLVRPFFVHQTLGGKLMFDATEHVAMLAPLTVTALRIWGPIIERYGPPPSRITVEEALALADFDGPSRRESCSYTDGLKRQWWTR